MNDDDNNNIVLVICRFLFSTKKQQKEKQDKLQSINDPIIENADMEEILGLCSGQFTGAESKTESNTTKRKPRSLFGTPIEEHTESNMDELLGLCSGMFGSEEEKKTAMDNTAAGLSETVKEDCSKEIDSNDKLIEKDDDENGDVDDDDNDDDDDHGGDDDGDDDNGDDKDLDDRNGDDVAKNDDDDDDSIIDMEKFRANKKYQKTYGKAYK